MLEKLILKYELLIQSIEIRMSEFEETGQTDYYRHRLMLYKRFINDLKMLKSEKEGGYHGNKTDK